MEEIEIGNYLFSYKFKAPSRASDYDYSNNKRYLSFLIYTLEFKDKYTHELVGKIKLFSEGLETLKNSILYISEWCNNSGMDYAEFIDTIDEYHRYTDLISSCVISYDPEINIVRLIVDDYEFIITLSIEDSIKLISSIRFDELESLSEVL